MASRLFNQEEVQFIKDNVVGKSDKELTELFNKTFNRDVTAKQIYVLKKKYHLRNGIYSRPDSLFNKEEKQYILDNIEGKLASEFAEEFNKKFNRKLTEKQIQVYKSHHKIKSNRRPPKRYNSLFSEHKNKDGKWMVKIKEPNIYIPKSRYIYEKYIGKIPCDCLVIFADGNQENFDLDNLILISRKEHFIMATHGLKSKNKDLLELGMLLAKESVKRTDIYMNYLKENNYNKYLTQLRKRHKANNFYK